jgi:hypothetical protein
MGLMSFGERKVAFEIPGFVEDRELSAAPDFNDRFIVTLSFPDPEATIRSPDTAMTGR